MAKSSFKKMGGDKSLTDQQEQNTAKLVMGAFYRVADKRGVTPDDITNYLQDKFGDVWKPNVLTAKAEEALAMSVALGFLRKEGGRYLADVQQQKKVGTARNSRRSSRGKVSKRRPRSFY